jgi:hypothetical protein
VNPVGRSYFRPVLPLCALWLALAAGGCSRDDSGPPPGNTAVDTLAAPDSGAAGGDVASTDSAAGGAPVDSAAAAVLARFRARLPDSVLVRRGACPFECCTYREWVAEGPIAVVGGERDRGRPRFTIAAGERFRADSGNVWITGLLLVAVQQPVADAPYWSFVAGDTLVVLDHLGEGHFNVWHAGRVQDVEGFWEPWRDGPGAGTLGAQRSEWWVHVTLPDGRAGWFEAAPEVRFAGADACA